MEKNRAAGRDRELSRALSENLEGNFERVIRVFQDRLYSFSLRLAANGADAEEIVQEGFVRAYRALKTYPPGRIEDLDLKPWLYRIVLNVFRTRARKGRPRLVSLENRNLDQSLPTETPPEEILRKGEVRTLLARALASLPERYRLPLSLRYVDNLAYAKIREILKQPEGTLKANVHRGIRLLRERLSEMTRGEWS